MMLLFTPCYAFQIQFAGGTEKISYFFRTTARFALPNTPTYIHTSPYSPDLRARARLYWFLPRYFAHQSHAYTHTQKVGKPVFPHIQAPRSRSCCQHNGAPNQVGILRPAIQEGVHEGRGFGKIDSSSLMYNVHSACDCLRLFPYWSGGARKKKELDSRSVVKLA